MNRPATRALVGLACCALVVGLVASSADGAALRPDVKDFTITGDVSGLLPGVPRPLVLSLANPNASAITVIEVTVVVGDAGGGCAAGNLLVSRLARPVVVTANGRTNTALTAELSAAAPQGCQGRVFPLAFHGRADKS